MSVLDYSKINPLEPMRVIEQMRQADMLRYGDSREGLLKQELAVAVTTCPCCASDSGEAKYLFRKDAFKYFQCPSCSHVYVNPRLNDVETAKLYTAGRCFYQTKNFYLPTAEYRKSAIYARKIQKIEERTAIGQLLDFGSSTGYFLLAAQERGWSVSGVELNPFGVAWARDQLGLQSVYDRPLVECGFQAGQFGVITLWDVLEHLSDPFSVVQALRSYLSAEGIIVIETSHFECVETDILKEANTNIVGDMHLMHFTRVSLEALMTRAGYRILDFEVFGLDLRHISNYYELNQKTGFKLSDDCMKTLQECVDQAGRGCYIKVVAAKA